MYIRKINHRGIALLIILVLLTGLAACKGSQNDYGGIDSVEIDRENDSGRPAGTGFSEMKNPFENYSYRTVDFSAALMSFKVPDKWHETIVSPSCIRYRVPDNDKFFPGCTLYIKCLYSFTTENDLDELAGYASEYAVPMSPYITGLPYAVDGGSAWINRFSAADESYTPSFCKDKKLACVKVVKDVVLMDKTTGDALTTSGVDHVAGYLKWNGFPVMIEIAVPSDWTENAKKLVEYMMSGVEPLPQKYAQMESRECNGLSFVLPEDFEPESDGGNIFRTSAQDISATSGMAAGVFEVKEDIDTLTLSYVDGSYAGPLAEALLGKANLKDYQITTSVTEYGGSQIYDEELAYAADVNVVSNEADYKSAENLFGASSDWFMDMFFVKRGGRNYLVAAIYTPQQEPVATKILKALMQDLR